MNKILAKHGLFFAPDPGANASVGGMIANNAAGTRTPKYGATRDNVLGLEVVLANGETVRTGCRSVKQSAGYDLTHLFVGSEGTLGLVTEATLKLAPLPAHFSAATTSFPTPPTCRPISILPAIGFWKMTETGRRPNFCAFSKAARSRDNGQA